MLTDVASEPSEVPTPPQPPLPWFRVWIQALTRPNPETFTELANTLGASSSRAFIWIFLAGLVDYLAAAFVEVIIAPVVFGAGYIYEGVIPGTSAGWLCAFPLYGVVFLLAFMLMIALIQGTARLLGGSGTFPQLAFVSGALAASFSLLTALLLPFVAIPYAGLCFSLLVIILTVYILGLQISAIKGIHQLGWVKASLALILPGLVLGLPTLCTLSALWM